jgi:hypothetical protein
VWFRRRANLPEGGAARVGGSFAVPLLDGKGGRKLLSESESELTMNGSKEFIARLVLRWGMDWAEDNVGPSACEEWMGGEGWRTLLRRDCP